MQYKRTGCLFLFFLLFIALFIALMVIFERNTAAFWWMMGGIAAAVAIAAVLVRIFGKKPGQDEPASPAAPAAPEASEATIADAPRGTGEATADETAAAYPIQPAAPQRAQDERPVLSAGAPAPAAPAEPLPDAGNLLYAGAYSVGADLPAGKYDFRAMRGVGTLLVKKADGNTKLCASLGADDGRASVEYRNAVCEDGDTLTVDGSVVLAVRKSRPIVIE